MALQAGEQLSGGFVRDPDDRLIVVQAIGTATSVSQFQPISTAAAGATSLVAAAGAGVRIWVVEYTLVASGAVTVKFQSATTDLTGAMALAANGGISAAGDLSSPLFATAANAALNINLGGAVQVSGHLAYFTQ